jgi:hypothetical protein
VWCRVCEAAIQEAKNNMLPISGTDTLVDKPYEKKFLNFNRRWRPHRPALVALLYATGILDKGYVSLAASDWSLDWNNGYLSVISKYIDNPELKKEMSERNKIVMNSEIIKNKISQGMLNSKKYQQMIKDKKVGNINNKCHTEESKNKLMRM